MKRRSLSIATLLFMLLSFIAPCAFAEGEESVLPDGEWVLIDQQNYTFTTESDPDFDPDNYTSESYTVPFAGTHDYSYTRYKYTAETEESESLLLYFYSKCEFDNDDMGFPPKYVAGGETLVAKVSVLESGPDETPDIDIRVGVALDFCDPDSPMRGIDDSDKVLCSISSKDESAPEPVSKDLTMTDGKENGDRKAISFRSKGCETRWIYEWQTHEIPEEVAKMGKWKLVEHYVHVPEKYNDSYKITYADDGPDDVYTNTLEYSGTEMSHSLTATEDSIFAKGTRHDHHVGSCSSSISGAPPEELTPGEAFKLSASLSVASNECGTFSVTLESTESNLYWPYRGEIGAVVADKFEVRSSGENGYIFTAPIPEYPEETHYCGVRYQTFGLVRDMDILNGPYTDWIYEWVPDPDAIAAITEPNTDGGDEPTTVDIPGAHVVIDKDAKEEKGEDSSKIPAAVMAAVLGVVGAGSAGAAAAAGKASKNGKDKKKDDDDVTQSTFEMRIYKEFGDTICVDEEVTVYARIVEVTKNGIEKDRTDLTSLIEISSPEYLKITHQQMAGVDKAAMVIAFGGKDDVPERATITFRFAANKGSFTEHVHFYISNPQIIFFQDNLTLPAGYDKTEELPFLALGMTDPDISVKIKGKDYEVKAEKYEEYEYGTFFNALVTEKVKTQLDVGETTQNTLTIIAEYTDPNGKPKKIEEQICIYRMGMGIILDVSHIGCYIKKNGEPAVTKGHMMLLTWDEEKHEIIRAVVPPKTFSVVHWYADKTAEPDKYTECEMKMIELLGIELSIPENAKIDPEKGVECELQCRHSVLDSPQILRCDIIISVEFNGKTYETKKEFVELTSQPMRKFKTPQDEKAALDKDKKIEDFLIEARDTIVEFGLEGHMYPMMTIINIMLDKYDKRFGYDERRIQHLKKAYTDILSSNKAIIDAELAAQDHLASTFFGKCSIVADYAMQCENSMSLGTRLLVGVGTLGYSEIAFASCKVYRSMRDTVINSDSNNTFFLWAKSFTVGSAVACWEIAKNLAFQEVMKGPAHLKSRYAQVKTKCAEIKAKISTGKAPDVKAFNASAKAVNGNVNKSITSKINAAEGSNMKAAGQKGLSAANEAKASAEQAIRASKDMPLSEADKAFEKGVELSRTKLEQLAAAQGEEFVELAKSVQLDKYSITLLKRLRGDAATELRKRFNNTIQELNQKTIDLTRKKLAKQYGCNADDIVVFRGSSNSMAKLKNGSTTTYDLDVTYRIVSKDGVPKDIPQKIAQKLHNESCHKIYKGTNAPSEQAAQACADGFDHSVVQKGSAENFGSESVLEKLVDPTKQGMKMSTSEAVRAGETIAYKGAKRLRKSEYWSKEAADAATPQVRESALKAAAMEKAEGMRSIVKDGDLLIAKDQIAVSKGSPSAITKDVRFALETYRKVNEGTLTPDRASSIVKKVTGMDPDAVCQKTGALLGKINRNLAG